MSARRKFFFYSAALALIIIAWFAIGYYLSLRTLTVNYENIKSVSVYSAEKIDDTKSEKPLKTVSSSGQEIKLKKGSYILQYDANDNYQDYFVSIDLAYKHQAVSLSPDYSDAYLDELLEGEMGSIKKSIEEKYPRVKNLYEIQKGKLYKKGEWYGTTLVYKGDIVGGNLFKTDTLRVILSKESGRWVVKTNPPNILLDRYDYPDIPEDILRSVNALPSSPAG